MISRDASFVRFFFRQALILEKGLLSLFLIFFPPDNPLSSDLPSDYQLPADLPPDNPLPSVLPPDYPLPAYLPPDNQLPSDLPPDYPLPADLPSSDFTNGKNCVSIS